MRALWSASTADREDLQRALPAAAAMRRRVNNESSIRATHLQCRESQGRGGAFVFCCCGRSWSSGLSACMSLDGTPCAVARIDKKENKTRVPRRHQRRSLCLTPPRAPLSAAFRSAWVQTLVPQSQLQAQ
jgi:hypothetical protein